MIPRLNKNQLDLLATIFGAISGIATVFITQDLGDRKVVGTVGGCATVLLGIVTQRPTNAAPTTEDIIK